MSFFAGALSKYTEEHKMAIEIQATCNIGMMLVDAKQLKNVLIPSPLKCLQVGMLFKYFSVYLI